MTGPKVALVFAFMITAPAYAQVSEVAPDNDYGRSGFYFALGGGIAIDTAAEDALRSSVSSTIEVDNSGVVDVRAT